MMEVEMGATARVDSPPVVVAREASLPRPLSPHTSEEKTIVDTGDVQSYNHDEEPNSHTKLFTHDDNHESYDLWVHPSLPDRGSVVAGIEVRSVMCYNLVILSAHQTCMIRGMVDES